MTVSTLYLDHFQLNRVPFAQEPDTRIFFPVAGRKEVLENLLADIEKGRPLVKVTGSEGTGKTLMCRLLEQSLDSEKYLLISLEHPIGSYENLLRTVCHVLGTSDETEDEEDDLPPDYLALFREHLQRIKNDDRNLVLLIDEAENLFLATLERLVRLICDSEESNILQVILIGRLDLDDTMDQLAIYCSNVDINAGYTLDALSPEETKQYIQFRLQGAGIPGDKYLDLFSDDAIDMIFQAAMGNISLTNSLAEEALKKSCALGMFQVEDELIQPSQSIEDNVYLAFFQGYDFLIDNKWWLLAGTLLVWVLLMLLWPDAEKLETNTVNEERLEIIMPEQEIVIPPVPDIVEQPPVVEVEKEPVDPPKKKPEKRMRVERGTSEPKPKKTQVTQTEVKAKVVPEDRKKKTVSVEPVPRKKKESPRRDADVLFNERVKASSAWLAWAYRGGYTVQLMVLASENAEDNLKQILVDDKYYEIKEQLYILRKISPQTIFVFYGNYPSMDKARQARNNMPSFLREIQPYALSIQDALKKIE